MKKSALVLALGALLLSGCTAGPAPTAVPAPLEMPTPSSTPTGNVWSSPGSVTTDAIPLGDGHVSTTAAAVGSVLACRLGDARAGKEVPWIHGATWNSNEKIVVAGNVAWPTASFTVSTDGTNRVIVTNDLPSGSATGTFPIALSDPAYRYDGNPNAISDSQSITITLPMAPAAAATPNCLPGGGIGVLLNGVLLFDSLDAAALDAVAHEEQDLCQGHPQMEGQYHYHEIPTCLRDSATGSSTVVGWAYDGYPIVVERDVAGTLPTNADLDDCHGRTSPVTVDGELITTYHYSATLEYPYTLGCFHGTSTVTKPRP